MNVRFIDTSVMANMLKIPGKCNAAESVTDECKVYRYLCYGKYVENSGEM